MIYIVYKDLPFDFYSKVYFELILQDIQLSYTTLINKKGEKYLWAKEIKGFLIINLNLN